MQLVHNGEGLYCLHTPFSEQAKKLFSACPHRKKHLLSNLKSEEKKSCKRLCTKTSRRGRTKMSARNRPVEAKMYVDLYIKLYIYIYIYIYILITKGTLLCVWAYAAGGVVAQLVERTTPGEEVPGSILPVAARSLLVGSVSV